MQFARRLLQPRLEKVWKVKIEGKVKFYMWLLLRNRNWTADRMLQRGLNCNPVCRLCDQEPETALHLAMGCSYGVRQRGLEIISDKQRSDGKFRLAVVACPCLVEQLASLCP